MKKQLKSYLNTLSRSAGKVIDIEANIMEGKEESGPDAPYSYLSMPVKNLSGDGIILDEFDNFYKLMVPFLNEHFGDENGSNIYLTRRDGKLVVEIAW